MPKIITITFNPAIDKSTVVEALLPEKKLRCQSPVFEPGGGGINVARAIKRLGGDAMALYPSGGHTGLFLNQLLLDEGINTIGIKIAGFTRENFIVREEASNLQYRFGMPGSPMKLEEWQEILKVTEGLKDVQYIVASGSLPPGVPLSVFSSLASLSIKMKSKLVVDTSGEALKEAAAIGVYLLKPNLGELATLIGKERIETDEIIPVCREIINKGKASIIVVSMGEEGAVLVNADSTFRAKAPHIERKSTVGAGDSMVAGLVYSFSQNKSLLECLRYGVACGTAATMNAGTELCRLDDVKSLINRMNS